MTDPYSYPNTNVLKNKFKTIDQEILNTLERQYSTTRLSQIREKPIAGNFDLKHLEKIHAYVFQDVYDWAGKTRTVNIEKTTLFCPLQNLDSYQQETFEKLKKENYLKGLDIEQFSKKAAYYLGELNMIHPFREGNGRTQREFMRELALNAGYDLDLESPQISKDRMIAASIQSVNVDNKALESIIRENIKPIELVKQEDIEKINNAQEIVKLPKMPQSQILFAAYAKAVLNSDSGKWTKETNEKIAKKMLLNGVSPQRTETAMKNSPQKIKDAHELIRKIREIPEVKNILKQSKGLSR